jgi:hypothetical protein
MDGLVEAGAGRSMTTHKPSAGTVLRRAAWAVAAGALFWGGVFEAAKHGGSTTAWAALGVLGPGLSLVAEVTQRRVRGEPGPRAVALYHRVHRPWLPLGVMIGSAFTEQPAAAGLFALGCTWLGRVAIERACGRRVAAYQHRSVLPSSGQLECAGMPTSSAKP